MTSFSNREKVIKPPGKLSLDLAELWRYKELFLVFTWRDIKVKFKQTLLGFLWVGLQPILMMLIFIVFFANTLKISTADMPPAIFYFSGLLLWTLFSTSITGAGMSMISNAQIIKKIYFPRLIIPISSILSAVFDFLIALVIFLGIVGYYYFQGFELSLGRLFLYLPLGLMLTIIASIGIGSLIASLNVKYRDFRYIIPFLVQLLFFLTPVIYPVSIFSSSSLEKLMSINPMTGAIALSRAAFTTDALNWSLIAVSFASAILLFFVGLYNFKRTESYFADLA